MIVTWIYDDDQELYMNWSLKEVLTGSILSRIESLPVIQAILANSYDKYASKSHYVIQRITVKYTK